MAIEPGRQWPYHIKFTPAGSDPNNSFVHVITAHTRDGKQVGQLNWYADQNKLGSVSVDPEHRRNGVGTAMWQKALTINPHLEHSEDRTLMGDAWAKAVGGVIPPNSGKSL